MLIFVELGGAGSYKIIYSTDIERRCILKAHDARSRVETSQCSLRKAIIGNPYADDFHRFRGRVLRGRNRSAPLPRKLRHAGCGSPVRDDGT